jgi:signal transduction histidine kinase
LRCEPSSDAKHPQAKIGSLMMTAFSLIIYILLAAHALLLVLALLWRARALFLLIGVIALSAASIGAYLLPSEQALFERSGRGVLLVLSLAGLTTLYGSGVINELRTPISKNQSSMRWWMIFSVLWLLAIAVTLALNTTIYIGETRWPSQFISTPDTLSMALLVGIALSSLIMFGVSFYRFYRAKLPEVANRALFWVFNSALLVLAILLILSGEGPIMLIGGGALLIAVTGVVYAHVVHRMFDVRGALGLILRVAIMLSLTIAIIFSVALFVGNNQLANVNTVEGVALLFALAIGISVLYMLTRTAIDTFLSWLLKGRKVDPATATRRFSQHVSKAVELDQLATAAAESLAKEMRVRRAGLLLINDTADNQVQLRLMSGGGETRANLGKSNHLYQELIHKQQVVAQFDLEFAAAYRDVSVEEQQFFKGLQMSVYAPIVLENATIGILASGSKLDDTTFEQNDYDLLMAMAHQTGVALRNARLVADLRHLNSSMRALNKVLEDANDQMEKLDSVKTDFITIASHELRTPLAQIRGYTDIVDALNEQGMLNKDQTSGLVANLRKANERMEELIAAMLDVSQIDVNAMDLRFAQTTIETVVRMAIEPLTDAIKQRKLTLSARGLRGLPPIQADMQRLVQAFRNVVVNAIKFTPDNGRIEILAELQPSMRFGETDRILVSIKDTGVGIAKENLELIFKKFFRAYDPGLHSTGSYKFLGAGPGLGLTIAKGVIEGHGGEIWAESPGHSMETTPGSTFYVRLPISPPEDAKRVMQFEGTTTPTPSE